MAARPITDQATAARATTAGVDGPTRRELVRGGIAATAATTLAATVPALLDPPGALGAPVSDTSVLMSLLRVEQIVVFAYGHSLATGILSAVQPVLTTFLDQERAHVHALSVDLTDLGGTVPAPPTTMAAFESELRHLRVKRSPAKLRNERQHLNFLTELEIVIARHYRFAIELLQGGDRLSTAAEIMGNEAQHESVLRELLSPGNVKRAVPTAFVAGTA